MVVVVDVVVIVVVDATQEENGHKYVVSLSILFVKSSNDCLLLFIRLVSFMHCVLSLRI